MLAGKRPAGDLSPSHEHYLRAIWTVRERSGYARLTDVARELGVSHATLSVGLQPLEKRRLLTHDANRFLVLTPRGERAAREVHHRFMVMRTFLNELLGVELAVAEREACLLEHDVSRTTVDRVLDLLRLVDEDPKVRSLFRERLVHYHRSCASGEACATCDLSCLTTIS